MSNRGDLIALTRLPEQELIPAIEELAAKRRNPFLLQLLEALTGYNIPGFRPARELIVLKLIENKQPQSVSGWLSRYTERIEGEEANRARRLINEFRAGGLRPPSRGRKEIRLEPLRQARATC
ncbi:hypothetical protein HYT84_01300 [Candidatus Micrarchaeota archaeon]|nr:hypothetical protein [Candidatus Micrarchaeota archaeon]